MSSNVSVQGPAVRLVFERYDSGLYSPEKVVTTLQGLGIKTPKNFVELISQFSRSRNLPYREFLKALTSETHEFPAEGLSAETIRQFNLRSAPVAAAAKAPFDTITENSDNSTVNAHRQRRFLTPAAHLESQEEEPHPKEHCKASDAVFGRTVDVFGEDTSGPTPRAVDERKRKLIAGHGDIITWQSDNFESVLSPHPAIPVSERKIAEVHGDNSLLAWSESRVVATAPLTRSPSILAFDENFERNKNIEVDVKINYPFATESDDLAAARARYHRQRIHKISASSRQ